MGLNSFLQNFDGHGKRRQCEMGREGRASIRERPFSALGEPIREFIERRLTLLTTLFVVLLVGGFVAIKYLF